MDAFVESIQLNCPLIELLYWDTSERGRQSSPRQLQNPFGPVLRLQVLLRLHSAACFVIGSHLVSPVDVIIAQLDELWLEGATLLIIIMCRCCEPAAGQFLVLEPMSGVLWAFADLASHAKQHQLSAVLTKSIFGLTAQ